MKSFFHHAPQTLHEALALLNAESRPLAGGTDLVTLMKPGPPLGEEMAGAVRRALADGRMGGLGLRTDDCRKTCEELTAKGVELVQPPQERPYGVEAVVRDNSGNWLVLVERKEFTPADFT